MYGCLNVSLSNSGSRFRRLASLFLPFEMLLSHTKRTVSSYNILKFKKNLISENSTVFGNHHLVEAKRTQEKDLDKHHLDCKKKAVVDAI